MGKVRKPGGAEKGPTLLSPASVSARTAEQTYSTCTLRQLEREAFENVHSNCMCTSAQSARHISLHKQVSLSEVLSCICNVGKCYKNPLPVMCRTFYQRDSDVFTQLDMNFVRRDSEDSRPDTISPLSTSNSLADQSMPIPSPTEFPPAHKDALQSPFKLCSEQELEAGRRLWNLFEQRFESRLEQIEKQNLLLQRHYTELFGSIYKLEQVVGNLLTKTSRQDSQPSPKRMRMDDECQNQSQEEPDRNSCPPQFAMKPFMELLVQFIKNNNSTCEESRSSQFSVSELAKNKDIETAKSAQKLPTPVHLVQNILSSVGSQGPDTSEHGENVTTESSQSTEDNQPLSRDFSFDRNELMANLQNRWQQCRKSSFEETSFQLASLFQNKIKNGFSINAMNEVFQRKLALKREHSDIARPRRMNDFSKKSLSPAMSQPSNRVSNLCERPAVILNPTEHREMFVGGVHTVKLPVWAYRKCLGMVRGAPHELGPRLCLRLLQSLFSLNYLVTHNYNGSGGKTPIDPTVMGAVLQQAQLQFGSDHFFTEPMALGKLRDYLNNAFRVMAFRQRKGERVRSPFWNEQGEPVLPLDPPLGYNMNNSVTGCIKDLNCASSFYRNHQAEVNSSSVDS